MVGSASLPLLSINRLAQVQNRSLELEELLEDPLQSWETGGIDLPFWAYNPTVANWVRQMIANDYQDAALVDKYFGFKEYARRLVFAYENKFPGKFSDDKPKLYTVLPDGTLEMAGEVLQPGPERALITYTYLQKIGDEAARDLLHTPFVRQRSDGTLNVVQTWPTKFNEQWKASFKPVEYPNNLDPDHFESEAVEEFKNAMIELFDLDELPKETLFCGVKETDNEQPVYVGTGMSLMAMLRWNTGVREALNITQLIEPNGFTSEYDDPQPNGEGERVKNHKNFYMTLHQKYCLYTKKGWEVMACPKPLEQFKRESQFKGLSKKEEGPIKEPLPPRPLTIEWSCEPACRLAGQTAWAVWSCAFAIVLFQVQNPVILGLAITGAVTLGVYADFSVMQFCIIAWTQRVKKLSIPGIGAVSYPKFLTFILCSTSVQVATIQMNALFLLKVFQQSHKLQPLWEYLWRNSGFWWLPCWMWAYITPASVAVMLFLLASLQLWVPMLSTSWLTSFPGKELQQVQVLEKMTLRKRAPVYMFHSKRPGFTWSQELATLAVACGLRYTSSMSISYPRAIINGIIEFKQGFNLRTPVGLEVMSQGWEMRALRTLRALQVSISQRMVYVLFFKLAGQMNLQVTYFNISRAKHNVTPLYREILHLDASKTDLLEMVSILLLLFTLCCEIIDFHLLLEAFLQLRTKVKPKLKDIENKNLEQAHYAFEDLEGEKRESYKCEDLQTLYCTVWCNMILLSALVLTSAFFILYAVLKFIMSGTCDEGLWQFHSSCLELPSTTDVCQ